MTNDKDLMRLHVEALFTLDDTGCLLAVNDPGGAAAPRFFLGRTADGNACWFRHDLDPAMAEELRALCAALPPHLNHEADPRRSALFIDRLERVAPVQRTWAGPAYRFPSNLRDGAGAIRVTIDNAAVLSPYLEPWRDDVVAGSPMTAVLEDGKAVSVCCSVRMTPSAHEAGVETHPDFRGRGHAARAVAAWAKLVRGMDRLPLYSTSWENESSRALASRLGLIQYGSDLHVT